MKPHRIACVTWGDAHGSADWKSMDHAEVTHRAVLVNTVGYLIKRDEVGVSLAQRVAEDGELGAIAFIPAGMIRKIKFLT